MASTTESVRERSNRSSERKVVKKVEAEEPPKKKLGEWEERLPTAHEPWTPHPYLDALKQCQDLAITNGIEKYIKDTKADVIFALTDSWSSGLYSPGLPAIAGWPILTVPLGYNNSVPFGAAFVTPKYQEEKLLQYGYAFEQATKARVAPQFLPNN